MASKGTERSQQRQDETRRDSRWPQQQRQSQAPKAANGEWRARDGREAWKGHGPGSQAGQLS
ncbi:hypothetical protein BO85DRAFT_452514 [Aspergillus piperis CBS 112811]|uniref:Uncharacterized protein n=1 Tax=Aspergillus piperis CBS 112811 TaxID=1448313 RepID=A0A8G1VI69_9EURO|nr:hypothetical protein BO85DRAFT_452514 [Aspergillus piperis CBS 112811]RAH54154.1 hypothetical protein BO85DRAFT_452514 [Aspergillus piperis CBS 112811]